MSVFIAPHRVRPVSAQSVEALYKGERWWPARTSTAISQMLTHGPAVGAWDEGEVVGFARAVTDGVFRAYVEDVVVLKRYRGLGVGRQLMEGLHQELGGVGVVSVFCHGSLRGFYAQAGYTFTSQSVGHHMRAPRP